MPVLFVNQVIAICVQSFRAWVPAFAGMTGKKLRGYAPLRG